MRASFAFQLYAKKGSQILEIFLTLLGDKSVPVKIVNGGRLKQLALENQSDRTEPPFRVIYTQMSFEVPLFLFTVQVL